VPICGFTEIKNAWSNTSTSPMCPHVGIQSNIYGFMAWYLVKYRDIFTVYLWFHCTSTYRIMSNLLLRVTLRPALYVYYRPTNVLLTIVQFSPRLLGLTEISHLTN